MAMQGATNRLKRVRIDPDQGFMEGGWYQPIQSALHQMVHYEYWKGGQTGGKPAASPDKTMTIGGAYGDTSPDPLTFIKQIDPQNSTGNVYSQQESLDMMMKFQQATFANSLIHSIQPIINIIGSKMYGAMKKAGAKSKAKTKVQNANVMISNTDIANSILSNTGFATANNDTPVTVSAPSTLVTTITLLIDAAIDIVANTDPDQAISDAENLNSTEITNITTAYNKNNVKTNPYVSVIMSLEFIAAINSLIPFMRIQQTQQQVNSP